jgi:hypothetical protein
MRGNVRYLPVRPPIDRLARPLLFMSAEIPRELRRKTLQHFQEFVFRNESVRRVLELESGKDASDVVFDGNWFCHKTNPLFVDIRTGKSGE